MEDEQKDRIVAAAEAFTKDMRERWSLEGLETLVPLQRATHKRFVTQVKAQSGIIIAPELAKTAINAYRRKYWKVVQFWRHLESAFRSAVEGQTVALAGGKIHVMPMDQGHTGVKIRIPSGSFLYYHNASAGKSGLSYEAVLGTRIQREHIYGGLLTEHVVSSTARDLMASSMFKIEAAGFEVLNTVHDEVWAQAAEGYAESFEQTIRIPILPKIAVAGTLIGIIDVPTLGP